MTVACMPMQEGGGMAQQRSLHSWKPCQSWYMPLTRLPEQGEGVWKRSSSRPARTRSREGAGGREVASEHSPAPSAVPSTPTCCSHACPCVAAWGAPGQRRLIVHRRRKCLVGRRQSGWLAARPRRGGGLATRCYGLTARNHCLCPTQTSLHMPAAPPFPALVLPQGPHEWWSEEAG
jgi:hypothetical protein